MLWVLKRTVSISGSYNGLENIYNFKLKKCLCKCVRNAHKAETLYRIKKVGSGRFPFSLDLTISHLGLSHFAL